jgi:hypothetical protein
MLEALKATDGLDVSDHLFDLDSTQSIDALIAGQIDVAIFPQLDSSPLQRALLGVEYMATRPRSSLALMACSNWRSANVQTALLSRNALNITSS